MNYRLKDKSFPRYGSRIRWIGFGVILLLLFALRIFAPEFTSHAIQSILSPFLRTGAEVSSSASITEGILKSKRQLIAENEELRQEALDARLKLSLSSNLQAENDEFRKLLGFVGEKRQVAALVLSKPPLSPYDSLLIEFGSSSTVEIGQKVFAEGNILLGEVSSVDGTVATVKLYSTAGNEIEATIERNSIAQKAIGSGGGNFEVKAPKEVDVAEGDVLVIPGLDKKVLGIVHGIDSSPNDSFQHILVKSPVNIFQLKWVTVAE